MPRAGPGALMKTPKKIDAKFLRTLKLSSEVIDDFEKRDIKFKGKLSLD